jgi:hypothetical protein
MATSGPIRRSTFSYSTEAIDGKTRVRMVMDLKLSGFYKLAGPLIMGRSVRQGNAEAESRLGSVKRILESEAKS